MRTAVAQPGKAGGGAGAKPDPLRKVGALPNAGPFPPAGPPFGEGVLAPPPHGAPGTPPATVLPWTTAPDPMPLPQIVAPSIVAPLMPLPETAAFWTVLLEIPLFATRALVMAAL